MTIEIKEYAQLAARVYATTENNKLLIPSGWDPLTLIADQSDVYSFLKANLAGSFFTGFISTINTPLFVG